MNNISIAIIICTYKREQYVLKNIDFLRQYKKYIHEVYVIDNGQTLDTSMSDDYIHIIPNKNLGGSGGYARGMYEVRNTKNTHIWLMDDDIEIIPGTIEKAYERLSNFTEEEKEDWIGFGMVTFDKPNILFECGAYWDGIRAHPNNQGLDLTSNKPLNDKLKYNYSAWWSLIMPITVIKKYGYPYPFFIKFDDTEYGMRRQGEKIHFYKNLYVKHEDFRKKYNPMIDYYGLRNSLITNIIHFDSKFLLIKRIFFNTMKRFLTFKFKKIQICSEAIADFLKKASDNQKNKKLKYNKINLLMTFLICPFLTLINIIKFSINYKKIINIYSVNFKEKTSESFWKNEF